MKKTQYILLALLVVAIASLILIKSTRPKHPSPVSSLPATPALGETPLSSAMTPRAIETPQRISMPPPEVSPIETKWTYDITGKVLDIRDSSPVPDAEVSLFYSKYVPGEEPDREFITATTTDYNGEFFIPHPDIKKDSLLTATKPGWVTVAQSVYSRVLIGRFPLILYTAPEERIEGVVVDENNEPLEGVGIERPLPELLDNYLPARAASDENGRFVLSGLLPGTYQFYAIKEGFAFQEIKDIPTGTKDLVIQMQRGPCSIRGRVESFETAEPFLQAKVTLTHMGRNVSKTITDTNGEFGFGALAPGRYRVIVIDPFGAKWLASESLTLDEGQEVTQLVIKCETGIGMSGRVVDDDTGKPITECWIGSYQPPDIKWKKVDSQGRFSLPNIVLLRNYIGLAIKAPGYIYHNSYGGDYIRFSKNIEDVKELENIEIRLKRAHQARGVVLSPDGTPLPDVLLEYELRRKVVETKSQVTEGWDDLKTNELGEFTFWCLPFHCLTCELNIRASHPQFGLMESTFKPETWCSDTLKIRFPPVASLEVAVKEEKNSQPVNGARINLATYVGQRWYNNLFVTDNQGMATIGCLAPGRYKLDVYAPGTAPSFIDKISLAQGEVKQVEVLLTPGRSLWGKVEDKQGDPVADAQLQVYRNNVTVASTASNEDGRFSLNGLPHDKTLGLVAEAPGFISSHYRPKPEEFDSESPLVIVMSRKPMIKGQVISALDGQPIEDYKLSVYWDENYRNQHFHIIERPEMNKLPGGYFELYVWQGGNFWLQATSPSGFSGELFDLSVKPDSQIEDAVIKMYPNATISGAVINAGDQSPIADASLSLEFQRFYICTAVSVFNQQTTSDAEGEFSFPQVAPGTYKMKITHSNFAPVGQEIEIQPGEQITDFIIELGEGTTVSGSVIDAMTRKPLPRVKVSIYSDYMRNYETGWGNPYSVTSDGYGDFAIHRLPYGSCSFSVEQEGYLKWQRSLELSRDKPQVDLLIELEKENTLAGYVYDESEQPINEANISLLRNQADTKWARTDVRGHFILNKIPPLAEGESATLGCHAEGFNRKNITITELNRTDFRIYLERAPTIRGKVVYSDSNEPATSYRIAAMSFSDRDQDYVFPQKAENVQNTNGVFELTNLAPGEYKLVVSSGEYCGEVRGLELRNKQILTDVVITISKAAALRGTVYFVSSDLPIAQAEVYVGMTKHNLRYNHFLKTTTDEEGTFSLGGLPENTLLYVKVLHPDYAQAFVEVTLPHQDEEKIELTKGAELHVQVLHEGTGEPCSDCRMRILCQAIDYDHVLQEPQNKESGEFICTNVPPQTHWLQVYCKVKARVATQYVRISPEDDLKFLTITIPSSQP